MIWAAITRHGTVAPRRSSPVRGMATTWLCDSISDYERLAGTL